MTEDSRDPHFEGKHLVIETDAEPELFDAQFLVAALLVYVAKGNGHISPLESEKMLEMIGEHFQLRSAESLELLTRAIANMATNPDLDDLLRKLSSQLSESDKEDVAVMMMKVIAADGETDADEMEEMRNAGEIVGISAEVMHNAHNRYFEETWTGKSLSEDDFPSNGDQ